MTRILVTGADGFIGHHFIEYVLESRPDWQIEAICSFHQGGIGERLIDNPSIAAALRDRRVRIHTADLTALASVQLVRAIEGVDYIANFASRSLVDQSLTEPVPFFKDNVAIGLTMLELARQVGPRLFLHISTDEVYGPAHRTNRHVEWSRISPSNPYSASKAAQEAAAFAWWRAYGVPVVITNTMNNIGERQSARNYLPMIIKRVLAGEEVTAHARLNADGSHTIGSRYYLHARNHADALLHLIDHFRDRQVGYRYGDVELPPRFNVVGDVEVDNLRLAQKIAELLDRPLRHRFVDAHTARAGHDIRYALDGSALAAIGWTPKLAFWNSLARTVDWYARHRAWLS